MSDFNQNQGENNKNNPNCQTDHCPPNSSQYPLISQDNENNLPTEQLIYSQNKSEINNQNNTKNKTDVNERISDAVEPLALNSDMTTGEPLAQLSEQPINEVEDDSQVQQMIPVYELEQPEQEQQESGCRLAIRHIIMIIIIIILLILIIIFATIKK